MTASAATGVHVLIQGTRARGPRTIHVALVQRCGPACIPARDQSTNRVCCRGVKRILVQLKNARGLICFGQSWLARELEVPGIVGQEVRTHIGIARPILRESSRVMIPSVDK